METMYAINNSEWELLSVEFYKDGRRSSCCPESYPDLTYYLHIRRKTFYYIFNIIVPCVMLSVLTMLTFWLPPTSGEKITLGLSVFLAFSMFMLLIAEEVPATSEAVPLIGIYLCVVMTMTSVSVIMAVLVTNIYNRGMKTKPAPAWLRKVTLVWLSKLLSLRHDIDRIARDVRLDDEEVYLYDHRRTQIIPTNRHQRQTSILLKAAAVNRLRSSHQELLEVSPCHTATAQFPNRCYDDDLSASVKSETEEVVWLTRDDLLEQSPCTSLTPEVRKSLGAQTRAAESFIPGSCNRNESGMEKSFLTDMHLRKVIVAEWQRIAAVIDRSLFWFYLLTTIIAYLVILVFMPMSHNTHWESVSFRHAFIPSTKS